MKKETGNKLDQFCSGCVTTENSSIHFGKWKGRRVLEIIHEDPGWLAWAANEGILTFDNDTYIEVQKAVELVHTDKTYRED